MQQCHELPVFFNEMNRATTHIKGADKLLSIKGRDGLYFALSLYTGFRASEILSLKWEDLRGDSVTLVTKRGKLRTAYLSAPLKQRLSEFNETGYVFKGRSGALTYRAALKMVKKRMIECGVETDVMSTHALRKTASRKVYEESGKDISVVCGFLDHSNPATTLRYVGVTMEERKKLFDSIQY